MFAHPEHAESRKNVMELDVVIDDGLLSEHGPRSDLHGELQGARADDANTFAHDMPIRGCADTAASVTASMQMEGAIR
jgi:hypothetical protein